MCKRFWFGALGFNKGSGAVRGFTVARVCGSAARF